jgi:hypothetical protein
MILAVFADNERPNDVYETYIFEFTYQQDDAAGVSLSLSSRSDVTPAERGRGSLQDVVRKTIFITESLHPLPEQCWLTIKLVYDEDCTPLDYSPIGFRDTLPDEHFSFAADDETVLSSNETNLVRYS